MTIRIGRTVRTRRSHCPFECALLGLVILVCGILCLIVHMLLDLTASRCFVQSAVPLEDVLETLPLKHTNTNTNTNNLPVVAYLPPSGFDGLSRLDDDSFGVTTSKLSLQLHREVQYCQWIEHADTKKLSDGSYETEFWYTKGWRSFRILSPLFDDPFSHHNPWRDPYPEYTQVSTSSPTIVYNYNHSLTEQDMSPDVTTIHIQRSIFDSSSDMRRVWVPTTASEMRDLQETPAYAHGFRYVGDGYFYSAHEEHLASFLTRTFLRFASGTLDVQIGDLFSTCTAGDIRVRFKVIDLSQGATVAVAMSHKQGRIQLLPFKYMGIGGFSRAHPGNIHHDIFIELIQANNFKEMCLLAALVVSTAILAWIAVTKTMTAQ